MTRRTAKTETKAKGSDADFLDLRIRLSDDGGPLFRALMQLGNSHVRGERVRQLMYLGFIRELELSVRTPDFHTVPPLARVMQGQASMSGAQRAGEQAAEPPLGASFDAGDLAAVFG